MVVPHVVDKIPIQEYNAYPLITTKKQVSHCNVTFTLTKITFTDYEKGTYV